MTAALAAPVPAVNLDSMSMKGYSKDLLDLHALDLDRALATSKDKQCVPQS